MIPKQILNYTIQEKIGEGSMGEVYLAVNASIGQKVAIKALHPRFGNNAALRKRFRNEAMMLHKLSHPNIVKFINYVENESGVYLIMDYVEGDTLEDYVLKKNGLIVEKKAYPIISQILAAFSYAHQRGIVHRDIKPSNIFIDNEGRVKVLDFGIAQIMNDAGEENLNGGGTPAYMSPEQVLEHTVDARSDIYSLGVVIQMILTGRPPFPKDLSPFEVNEQVVKYPLRRMKEIYPYVSDAMQEVVDHATAKDPAARYQDCNEMMADLDRKFGGANHSKARIIVFSILGLLVGVAAVVAYLIWDSKADKVEYYKSFSYVKGLPVGSDRVAEKEISKFDKLFRMEYANGRLISLKIVDGKGNVINPADSIMRPGLFPQMLYYYDNKTGDLAYCKLKDETNADILRIDYGPEFKTAIYAYDPAVNRRDSVMGAAFEYDPKSGRLVNIKYVDSRGMNTCDADSVYSSSFEYDSDGRLTKIDFLDNANRKSNNTLGVAEVKVNYDKAGVPTMSYFNSEGVQVVPLRKVAADRHPLHKSAPKQKKAVKKSAPQKKYQPKKETPVPNNTGLPDGYPGTPSFRPSRPDK